MARLVYDIIDKFSTILVTNFLLGVNLDITKDIMLSHKEGDKKLNLNATADEDKYKFP